jgi:hypothetical protein
MHRGHFRSQPKGPAKPEGQASGNSVGQSRRIGNVFRHDYDEVYPPLVWEIITDHLPALRRAMNALLRKAGKSRGGRRRSYDHANVRLQTVSRGGGALPFGCGTPHP